MEENNIIFDVFDDGDSKKEKFSTPKFLRYFAFICLILSIVLFVINIAHLELLTGGLALIQRLLYITGVVFIAIGTFGKEKKFATGCFIIAFEVVFSSLTTVIQLLEWYQSTGQSRYMSNLYPIIISCLFNLLPFIILGLYVVLKGKGINHVFKLIVAIIFGVITLISVIGNILSFVGRMMKYPFYDETYLVAYLVQTIGFIRSVFLSLIFIFYTPYKKAKVKGISE